MRGEKKKVMVFRIPVALAEDFATAARESYKTMTSLVIEVMRAAVKAQQESKAKEEQVARKLRVLANAAKPPPDLPALVSPLRVNSGKSKVILDRLLKKHPAVLTPRYRGAIEGSIANDIDILDALDPLYLESAGDDALEAEYDAFQAALMDVLNDQDN